MTSVAAPQLLHWHGLNLPSGFCSDGVPALSGRSLEPGESGLFTLPIDARERGTMMVHSHYGMDEQMGATAPLIVVGGGSPGPGDRVGAGE